MDLAKIEQKKQGVIFRVRGEKQSSRGLMRLGQCWEKIGLHKFNPQNRGRSQDLVEGGQGLGELPSARGEAKNLRIDDESDYWFLILMAKWMMFTRGNYPACSSSSRSTAWSPRWWSSGQLPFRGRWAGRRAGSLRPWKNEAVLHDLHRREEHLQRPLPGIRQSNVCPEVATRVVIHEAAWARIAIERWHIDLMCENWTGTHNSSGRATIGNGRLGGNGSDTIGNGRLGGSGSGTIARSRANCFGDSIWRPRPLLEKCVQLRLLRHPCRLLRRRGSASIGRLICTGEELAGD